MTLRTAPNSTLRGIIAVRSRLEGTSVQPTRRLLLHEFQVAALAYYDLQTAIHRIQAGDTLCLVAESTNPHDEFTVEIKRTS